MEDILNIVKEIQAKINQNTVINTTIYESLEELQEDLEIFIEELELQNKDVIDDLSIHFLDNCTFNNIAIANDWEADFKQMQTNFYNLVK